MKRSKKYTMTDGPREADKYGGLWFLVCCDGSQKIIDCKKDHNIMCKVHVAARDNGGVKEFYRYHA